MVMSQPPPILPIRIAGTAHTAPGEAVSTAELVTRLSPAPDAAHIVSRTGIASRHFAPSGPDTATTLAVETLLSALDDAGMKPDALRRIIYVSTVGGDVLTPANANQVAGRLGLAGTCDCMDLSNACMGFLTALDVAARSVATGLGPVGIVVVELGSRCITPEDPRPYLVFGDAAVAAVVDRGRAGEGVLASWIRNDAPAGGDVHMTHPLVSGQHERIRFTATNRRMGSDAVRYICDAVDAVLGETGLALADIEWVLPHQPNGALLDAILERLAVPAERVVRMVHDVGSVGAASIPVSLHRLRRSGRVRPGDRILLTGVGTGISYGAILLREGE